MLKKTQTTFIFSLVLAGTADAHVNTYLDDIGAIGFTADFELRSQLEGMSLNIKLHVCEQGIPHLRTQIKLEENLINKDDYCEAHAEINQLINTEIQFGFAKYFDGDFLSFDHCQFDSSSNNSSLSAKTNFCTKELSQ